MQSRRKQAAGKEHKERLSTRNECDVHKWKKKDIDLLRNRRGMGLMGGDLMQKTNKQLI